MNIQDIFNLVHKQREEEFAKSPQLSLGQLIAEIEKCGTTYRDGKEKVVCYDFGSAIPTYLDSWRGSYCELALGYELTGYDDNARHMAEIKASILLEHLKDAIGKEYTGWKGGEYRMHEKTPVWVANPGNSDNTAIVGVLDDDWRLILITAYCKY